MFIHLSNNESVSEKNIVGIFNLETASMQRYKRIFETKAKRAAHGLAGGRYSRSVRAMR